MRGSGRPLPATEDFKGTVAIFVSFAPRGSSSEALRETLIRARVRDVGLASFWHRTGKGTTIEFEANIRELYQREVFGLASPFVRNEVVHYAGNVEAPQMIFAI